MKTFYSRKYFWTANALYGIQGLILLAAIIFLIKISYNEWGIIFLVLLSTLYTVKGFRGTTYRITIMNDGRLIEKSWFHKTRILYVLEIEIIAPRAFESDALIRRSRSTRKIQAPKIINQKFKDFPRYIMPKSFFAELKKTYPNIKTDPNIKL